MKNINRLLTLILVLMFCSVAAFAGTTHSEGGPVNDASDGTNASNSTFKVFNVLRTNEVVAGNVGSALADFWLADVGTGLTTQWAAGDDHLCIVDQETGSGTTAHKGYYAVINKDITNSDPDQYATITLRSIPTPNPQINGSNVDLNWSVPLEDAGVPDQDNIIGYYLYRSTAQDSGFALVSTNILTTNNYTDAGVVDNTYYYTLKLVYRGNVSSNYYSSNSDAAVVGAVPPPVVADTLAPTTSAWAPANGAAGVALSTPVSFRVTDNISGVSLNTLQVIVAGTTYNSLTVSVNGSALDYTITVPTQTYAYDQVVGVTINVADVSGNVMPTDSYSFTIQSIPANATFNITRFVAIAGDGRVTMNWVNPFSADFVEIRRREDAYPWVVTQGVQVASWNSGIPETYTDTGLENGKLYYYVIHATANSGTVTSKLADNSTPVTNNYWSIAYNNPGTYPQVSNWYWQIRNGWKGWVSRNVHDYGTGLVHDPSNSGVAYSEGVGYGLLLAVINDDQPTFNYIFNAAETRMKNGNGLYSWKASSNGTVVSVDAATDADQDIALALIFADLLQREGHWTTTSSYRVRAQELINDIYTHEIDQGRYVLPGDNYPDNSVLNPSYFAPAWYRVFDQYEDTDHDWTTVINQCYTTLQANSGFSRGLAPDWSDENGAAVGSYSNDFTYDALRTLWRTALDSIWFNNTTAQTYANNAAAFIDAPSANFYKLNGSLDEAPNHSEISIAMWAAGVMGSTNTAMTASYNWEMSLYDNLVNLTANREFGEWAGAGNYYYNQALSQFGTAVMSGSFPNIYNDLNVAPVVSAALITSIPAVLTHDVLHSVAAVYVDSDGHGDLSNIYFRLENPETANDLEMRLAEGTTAGDSVLIGSTGTYITSANYVYTINGPTLNVTWNFIVSDNWTNSNTINAGIRAEDEHGHDTGYVYNTATAITYLIDNSDPVVAIITNGGADFTTINSQVILNGSVSSDAVVMYLNGIAASVNYTAGNTTWTATANFSEGVAAAFSVIAVDAGSNTSNTDTITITLDTTPPPPVNGLSALAGNSQAVVSWTRESTPTATGTIVVRATGDITWTPSSQNTYTQDQVVAAGVTIEYVGALQSFTDSGLTNGVEYTYAAFAYDGMYWYSSYSAGSTANVTPTPSAISNLQISRNAVLSVSTKETITLTWGGPTADVWALTNTFNTAFTGAQLLASGVTSPWIDTSASGSTVDQRYYRVVDEGQAPAAGLTTVGKFDFVLSPGSITNVSSPLIVNNTNANEVIGEQLTAANNSTDADWIKIGVSAQAYRYYRGFNDNWWQNNQAVSALLNNGRGFEIGIRPTNPTADITIVGTVAASTVNITLVAGDVTMIGRVYPTEISINSINLGSGLTSASNATEADKFIAEDNEAWLVNTGDWYTGNDTSIITLSPGKAYKIVIQGNQVTWGQQLE
ncbi:glycosyl hydrolase family 8 [Candidatus Margulisiibacteriota bacterium]